MLLLPPTMASLSASLVVDRSSLREISKIHHHAWNRLLSIRWHILRPAMTNVSKSKRRKAATITNPTKSVKNLISKVRIENNGVVVFRTIVPAVSIEEEDTTYDGGHRETRRQCQRHNFSRGCILCQPTRVPCNNGSSDVDPTVWSMFETCRIWNELLGWQQLLT